MDQADAAVQYGRTDGPFRYLKMNVGSPNIMGCDKLIGKVGPVEALDDSLLGVRDCDPS